MKNIETKFNVLADTLEAQSESHAKELIQMCNKIVQTMRKNNITQKELSKATKISQGTIARILNKYKGKGFLNTKNIFKLTQGLIMIMKVRIERFKIVDSVIIQQQETINDETSF